MGVIPRLRSFRREDNPDAPEWFFSFLGTLTPFAGDVTAALSGNLDASNLGKQFAEITLETSATPEGTFATRRVVVKNKLGFRPRSVTLGKCQPSTAPDYAKYDWQAPALTNAWLGFAGRGAPQYRIDGDGFVSLRGTLASGTIASAAFTLPVGFRPPADYRFASASNGAFGELVVTSAGLVIPQIGSNLSFDLGTARFQATGWVGLGPFGAPQWTLTSDGSVQIDYISGLSPNTKYAITLVLE